MAYKVSLLEEAAEEVIKTARFYKEIDEKLANDLLEKFFETITYISKNPFTNQVIRNNFRKSNLKRFPYKVIYRLKENEIIIVAFAHHKQKPHYWKKR